MTLEMQKQWYVLLFSLHVLITETDTATASFDDEEKPTSTFTGSVCGVPSIPTGRMLPLPYGV